MSTYCQILTALVAVARTRMRTDDRGMGTLETVIMALGLFLLATAVVAIITNAVMSRANQIQ